MKEILILGFFVIILQSTILGKILSVGDLTGDFLVIYVLLVSLSTASTVSLKSSFFLGIIQDIFSLNLANSISKPLVSYATIKLKNYFFVSSFWIKSFFVIFVSLIDFFVKNALLFIFSGSFEISKAYIIYLIINFIIFYLVYLTNENFKV